MSATISASATPDEATISPQVVAGLALPAGPSVSTVAAPRAAGALGTAESAARLAAIAGATVYLLAVMRLGWLSDDAFIAIRSVDHLVHGLGFSLNVGERVQSFTSPLGTLLAIPFFLISGSPYAALMVPALLACLTLVALVLRSRALRGEPAAVVSLALAASFSFTSFSTSGLENPFSHLIAAAWVLDRWRHGTTPTRRAFLLPAALFLTRMDEVLLALPLLSLIVVRDWRRALRMALPACAVVLAWLAFATFYFGFPFPNTAYAKLNVTLALGARLGQGFTYLVDAAYRDPIVVVALVAGGWMALRLSAPVQVRALMAGVALYLAYVVFIGGDFMSGRFLTTCYLVCVLAVVLTLGADGPKAILRGVGVGLVLMLAPALGDRRHAFLPSDCNVGSTGVTDERACYVESTGLPGNIRGEKWRTHGYLRDFENATRDTGHVVAFDLIGLASYANHDEKHVVERFALSDALLARIRLAPGNNWRPGHFFRELPAGYLETLQTGRNVIEQPCLHRLYDLLDPVLHGPLLSLRRMGAIARLNLGKSTCPAP